MECVVMGKKEQLKISIIENIIAGKLQQKKALDYLNVSERTLRRWVLSYKQKGIRSFVHGNKGRAPKNRKPLELKYKVTDLVKLEFYDFNLLHCLDKLQPFLSEPISRETLRRRCLPSGLIKNARKRRRKVRYKRPRFSQGLMVRELIQKARMTRERHTQTFESYALTPAKTGNEKVAEFSLTLSVKQK